MKPKLILILLTLGLFSSACNGMVFAAPAPTSSPTRTSPPSPTATAAPSLTPTSTQTFTPSPVPTATWVVQGPDVIKVPILMYHHVEESPNDSNYRVSVRKFEDQLRLLRDWEYTTITTEMLVKAITEGASLPARPVMITFDDGNIDNYTIAWPLMQKYGFTGVLYIVSNYIGADGFMNASQIVEMHNAGWEIGSHSVSHAMLTSLDADMQRFEIIQSRKRLQNELGIPILSFAYPWGLNNSTSVDAVKAAGYIAGMGATGFTADQGTSNLFVLQRCEIKGWEDAKTFIRFLPWQGDPIYLPTDTPTPTTTPSRTPIPTYTQYPTRTPAPATP
jgi:peptidoglycan/xylan/chitin deacetylase (PgdA/CDA1 family)